jgi:hypothetical protein
MRTDREILRDVYTFTAPRHRMDLTSEERARLVTLRAEIAERLHPTTEKDEL